MTKAEEKAKEIKGLMERHSLTLEEATQLWEEDNSDYCNEVELHFTKGGNDYTIKLIKHRKKK